MQQHVLDKCDSEGASGCKMALVTSVPTTLYHLFSNQIERIKSSGIDLTLISSSGDQWISYKDVEKKYGCKVYCVPFQRTFSLFADGCSFFALVKLLIVKKFDAIYYCTPKASLVTSMAAFFVRVPFRIYSVFGQVYYSKKGMTEKILMLAEKISCACSHKVIMMSKSNLDYMINKRLCHPPKMGLLGHGTNQGVDAKTRFNPKNIDYNEVLALKEKLGIEKDVVVMGYIGRLVRDKGIVELVNAWKEVKKDGMPCVLLLVGPRNEPRDQLPQSVYSEISTDLTIKLIEPVSTPELYYAMMDVFILPSYREGFPNVVLEASAMQVPVITTNAAGCIDSVIDGKTGIIVPQRDVDALIEKMVLLLHNHEMRKTMGKMARERVLTDFNADSITDELIYLVKNRKFLEKVHDK